MHANCVIYEICKFPKPTSNQSNNQKKTPMASFCLVHVMSIIPTPLWRPCDHGKLGMQRQMKDIVVFCIVVLWTKRNIAWEVSVNLYRDTTLCITLSCNELNPTIVKFETCVVISHVNSTKPTPTCKSRISAPRNRKTLYTMVFHKECPWPWPECRPNLDHYLSICWSNTTLTNQAILRFGVYVMGATACLAIF